MFAKAKENEQRSKERNLQLIDKLDKMEKKLTHVDMTRLRDARRQYLKYVESCLPAWRNRVRQYNETAAGRQGLAYDTDTAKSETGVRASRLLNSPPATTTTKLKSSTLSGPGMAGHQLLLPQHFPVVLNGTKRSSATGRLQDFQSDVSDKTNHVDTFGGRRTQLRSSDVVHSREFAGLANGMDHSVNLERPVASHFANEEFSQSEAVGMLSAQPVFHSTTIMDRHHPVVHSSLSVQTLQLDVSSTTKQHSEDLSVSNLSGDDESLSEGEIPTVDQHDAVVSHTQQAFPARQVVMSLSEQQNPTLSIRSFMSTVDQNRGESESERREQEMPPLHLSELQPTRNESDRSLSVTSDVKSSHETEDVEIIMPLNGSKRDEDANLEDNNTNEHEIESVEAGGQDIHVDKSGREESRSISISSVSSLSLLEPAVDEPSGESEETQSAVINPQDDTHSNQSNQSSQHDLPNEQAHNSVSQSLICDELNDASSDALQLAHFPVIDVSHLQRLFGAIEHDVAVGLEVDDLYRNKDCSEGMKKRIRETLDTRGDLERFSASSLTAVVLEIMQSLSAGDAGPLMPAVLLKKHTPMCKTESQFRAALAPHWVPCWELLKSHLEVLIEKRALKPETAATMFSSVCVSHATTNREKQEKAVQILSTILENACQGGEITTNVVPNTNPSSHRDISHPVDLKSSCSDESLSLVGDLGETDNQSEQAQRSVRLSETDAYKLLLAGSKSDHLDDDAAFSVSEDSEVAALENDLASAPTLEEGESCGLVHSLTLSNIEAVSASNGDNFEIQSDSKSSVSQLMSTPHASPALRPRSQSDRPISRTSISYLQDSDPESDLAEELWPGRTQTDGNTKGNNSDQDDFDFYD